MARTKSVLSEEELVQLSNAGIRLLRGLPYEERYELLRTSTYVRFARNDMIFQEGDPVEAIYVIKSGQVKLCTFNSEGEEKIVGMFGQYGAIWEGVYLKDSIYPYDGVCVTPVDMIIIYKKKFEELLLQPEAAIRTIGYLSHKLHDANERNKILSARNPKQRIAGFLLYWFEHNREEVMELQLPDIAASTCMRPETVSRKIAELEREGLIERVGRSGIVIRNYEGLQKIYRI